jgi:hypothetical protein
VLIRLAWRWLGRWQESLVVGAAVALLGLVYGIPAADDSPATQLPPSAAAVGTPARSSLALPSDAQFYRDQWARETSEFYAAHPAGHPSDAQTSLDGVGTKRAGAKGAAVTVAMATVGALPRDTGSPQSRQRPDPSVSQASFAGAASNGAASDQATAGLVPPQSAQPAAATTPAVSQRQQRWQVLSCLAAGLLASLAFAAVWPAAEQTRKQSTAVAGEDRQGPAAQTVSWSDPAYAGDAIAIRLPAAWVRVRPTVRQTLRRVILGASYLLAGLGVWGLLQSVG